jgi:DNA-binding response OmpR family regulator
MTAPLVLLVDDIPDHAKRYEAALKGRGYRVHLVHTSAAGLSQALHEPPACVVIDVRLPDGSGWDLCRQMKRYDALARVPVVVLTHETCTDTARESAQSGCEAWLAHPTAAQDVPRVVDHVLAQQRPSPASSDTALVGVTTCRACGSERIRATLRLGSIQHYACQTCRLTWRVESAESVA